MHTYEQKPNSSHQSLTKNVTKADRAGVLQKAQANQTVHHAAARAAYDFSQIHILDKGHKNIVQRVAGGPANRSRIDMNQTPRPGGLPLPLRAGLERLSGVSLSQVRVHANSPRPAQFGALAYTQGRDIHLGPGQGKHLPHEAWHVVQQIQGRVSPTAQINGVATNSDDNLEREADVMGTKALQVKGSDSATETRTIEHSVLQRRRMPGTIDTIDLVWEENADAHGEGLIRLVDRAWFDLSKAQRSKVLKRARKGKTKEQFKKEFPEKRDRYVFYSQALRIEVPGALHGDPDLYEIGPRDKTADAANITKLVDGAHKVFSEIASGAHDKSVGQVFGKSKVVRAKRRYARADRRMRRLKRLNKIVTDRSGYSEEVGLGGLTNSSQIMVSSKFIDNPTDAESIVVMIHESMHAGNSDVSDELGYIHRDNFTRLPEAGKLRTASYYEVVPRRIKKTAKYSFKGVTFIPAGKGVTPALSTTEQAIQNASNLFREAWTVGLNLHTFFVQAYSNPKDWNKDVSGDLAGVSSNTSFADSLPFWSKVEALTVHRKSSIDPASDDKSKHPVSIIDVALSEGVIRKIKKGQDKTPDKPAEAQVLEANASSAERLAIVGDADAEAELISKLVLKKEVGKITGDLARDQRVVKRMAKANKDDFSDMIVKRPPGDFS